MAEDKEQPRENSEGAPAAPDGPFSPGIAAGEAAQVRPGDPGSAAYPLAEIEYWRAAHVDEPYYESGRSFAEYSTAYELGWISYHRYGGDFGTADRVLANDWLIRKGISGLTWEQARPAARAAWQRAENACSFTSEGTATPDQVRETLTELFDSARDAELGLHEAAAQANAPEVAALLERTAQRYGQAAGELQTQVQQHGGAVTEGGSVAAAAQRVWLQLRGMLGASDGAILAICERAQDGVLARYRDALQRNLPLDLHALVQRQFEEAQRQHDHIKQVRDGASAAPADQELPA